MRSISHLLNFSKLKERYISVAKSHFFRNLPFYPIPASNLLCFSNPKKDHFYHLKNICIRTFLRNPAIAVVVYVKFALSFQFQNYGFFCEIMQLVSKRKKRTPALSA